MPSRDAIRSVKQAVSHVDVDAVTEQARSGMERLRHNLPQNVGLDEQKLSLLGGSAIGALALTRLTKPSGWILLGLGAALIVRGTTGYCGLYSALGVDTKHK